MTEQQESLREHLFWSIGMHREQTIRQAALHCGLRTDEVIGCIDEIDGFWIDAQALIELGEDAPINVSLSIRERIHKGRDKHPKHRKWK